MWRGSPGPGKRAKRVPPVPTPQVGIATPNAMIFSNERLGVDAAAAERARQARRKSSSRARRTRRRFASRRKSSPMAKSAHAPSSPGGRTLYRVKDCALPASTLRMLPVDFAERSLAKK